MIAAPQDTTSPMAVTEQPASPVQQSDDAMQADVKRWQGRIKRAKQKWEPDFKRMRRNMEFVSGLQWQGQQEMDDERYTNNFTLRMVNQKVATLYAKNPTAVAERRDRLDYQIWDGEYETIMQAVSAGQQMVASGAPLPVELSALFADYTAGKQHEKLVKRICDTLQKVYQYQVDTQRPDFKEQAKQAVRQTIVCGVGYCRPVFCRDDFSYSAPSSIDFKSGLVERMKRAKLILDRINEGEVEQMDAQVETLRSLALSIGASTQSGDSVLSERLEFDFPPATSIIPDDRCRSLKEFVSARWIAQEYVLPVEEVNALFQVDIKVGTGGDGTATEYVQTGEQSKQQMVADENQTDPSMKQLVCLYEVFDYQTRTRFFLCEGHKDYVLAPEPTISVGGFWHHFALTFNDVVVENNTKTSIYPPSDVQLIKSPQKEWNRTREASRDQRNANAPTYVVRKGSLTDADKDALRNKLPNSVIELEGVPPEVDPGKFVSIMQVARIDPAVYDTQPLEQDALMGAGMQQANVGPAQPNVTATVGTIAEQSRMTISSSNIDDLDGWLSRIAQCGGEILLREMSPDTVKRIVGPGSVWPQQNKEDFLNQIVLKIKAASSGRPNKAVDVANWRDLAPLMLQSGANPVGVIEETAKRLDDNMDISQFFPLVVPSVGGLGNEQPQGAQSPTSMPPMPSGQSSLPLAGPQGNGRAPLAAANMSQQ